MGKHAYLIMAHSNFEQLQKLISVLDDKRNDIYVHIDKKASGFQKENFTTKHSALFFVPRIAVSWGGRSQITCELELLKAAAYKKTYGYYHLISGQDLPLKTQDEIHAFFEKSNGKSYMDFDPVDNETKDFLYKVQYWYPVQDYIGRNKDNISKRLEWLQNKFLLLQKKLHYSRIKGRENTYYKGANWFSITDELVRYVLAKEQDIYKEFRYTMCADEIFLQTLAMNSIYAEKVEKNSMREIDWERGNPYVFRLEDYEMLMKSDALFARKFQDSVDGRIIDKIVTTLKNEGEIYEMRKGKQL